MGPGAPSRIVVTDVTPLVDGGRHPVKRVEGEPVEVQATAFADGHDVLWAVVRHRAPGGARRRFVPMRVVNAGLDRWAATVTPLDAGLHRLDVLVWIDHFASWVEGTRRKLDAGLAVDAELLAGAVLLDAAAAAAPRAEATALTAAAMRLRAGDTVDLGDTGSPERPSVATLVRGRLRPATASAGPMIEVLVEREKAAFNAWYELFPRSTAVGGERAPVTQGAAGAGHGTLRDVVDRLDHVAEMGFDVLYLPPIHPIGRSFRKGPDNAPDAGPDDVGSPWAIGSPEGGHTAVHPDLGTVDDLRHLVAVAAEMGIDVALDLAFQCSPDHPWVTEHPEWFRHRPDGTIQYAENPPKKYQDIYPLDFDSADWEGLWHALLGVAEFWMDQGVRVFRVDNPHTKPFAFWEWFAAHLRRRDPDVVLLSEAFTRPEVMRRLTTVGFTLSYSYFPWRVTKAELIEFATGLASPPESDTFRASLWPTTPDILPWHLQDAPREMFALRHLLAATLGASYGIYGPAFELCDGRPAGNGKEEYGRSEKYEIRHWDLDDPVSLRDQIATVNRARREQLALRTTRTLRVHDAPNDQLLAFSKTTHDGPDPDPSRPHRNPVLTVVNLDPSSVQRAMLHLDLAALGLDPARPFDAHDLLSDLHFTWEGPDPYVELRPSERPGHLLRLSQPPSPSAAGHPRG